MATPTKTQNQTLISWQDISTAGVVISSDVDVSTKFAAAVFVRMGRQSGTAFTAGYPLFRVDGTYKSSGNNAWVPLAQVQPGVGSSIVNTTLNGAVSANASTFTVTSATNIAAGDLVFLGDSSASNYEIVRVKSVSGTTITPEENVVNAHANSAKVTDQAFLWVAQIDLMAIGRMRAVVVNHSGQTISCEVMAVYCDSVG